MATINLKNGIDLPVMQQLAIMPYSYNYNAFWVCDDRRYIYWLPVYGGAIFYRYDMWTDGWTQLASHPVAGSTSSTYAGDMTICHTRGRIYVAMYNSTAFHYYDIEANVWSAAQTALPATPSTGVAIKHTCSGRDAAGNDDYIYYFNGDSASRKLYRYSIAGNSWSEMGTDVIPAAPGAAANLYWLTGIDANILAIVRGAATQTIYLYSISGNAILGTMTIKGTLAAISAGAINTYEPSTGEMFWVEPGTRQLNKTKLGLALASDTGTATSGADNSLTDSTKDWEENRYFQAYVTILTGTGAGQVRYIMSNTSNTLTTRGDWTVNPDNTSTYEIKFTVMEQGIITTAGTNLTTLTDSAKTWLTSSWVGCKIKIIAGTGVGQERFITANNATTLTVAALTVGVDSVYEIQGYKTYTETAIPYSTSATYGGNTIAVVPVKGCLFVYFARKSAQTDWFRYLSITP